VKGRRGKHPPIQSRNIPWSLAGIELRAAKIHEYTAMKDDVQVK
jgi:hypothetical protein